MNILDRLYAIDGISSVGVCEFETLKKYMNENSIKKTYEYCPQTNSVIVALFPYFTEKQEGNLSLYARGKDYHKAVSDVLMPLSKELESKNNVKTAVLVDNSPIPEVQAARIAGVGKIGENGLIFDPVYGSYVFIGTILTDMKIEKTAALCSDGTHIIPQSKDNKIIDCLHCGLCKKHCPAQAISDNGRIICEKCVSDLTQSKAELTQEQEQMIINHDLIWGCDICQNICPQNRNVKHTTNPDFTQNLINSLTLDDVNSLTRKQFSLKYPDRAFTWRGPKPILRNLTLKGTEK